MVWLAAFARALPTPSLAVDDTGRFRWANDAFLRLCGAERMELLASQVQEHLGGQVGARYMAAVRKVAATGKSSMHRDVEFTDPRDGHVIHLHSQLFRLQSTKDGVLVANVFWDVTADVAKVNALAASEIQFRELMDHSPLQAAVKDSAGRYIYANPAFLHAADHCETTMLGRTDAELNPPGLAEQHRHQDERVRATGTPLVMTMPLASDGAPRRATVYRFPIPQPRGEVHVGVVAFESTELMRAHAQLSQLELRYRAIVERAGIGIVVLDLHGVIEEANPAFCEMLGYRTADLVGCQPVRIIAPDELARHAGPWAALAQGSSERYQLDTHLVHRSRRSFRARTTFVLVRGAERNPQLIVAMIEPFARPDSTAVTMPARLRLSDTEITLLEQLTLGRTNESIARSLGITRQAIGYHLLNVRRKLDVTSTRALPARAYALGIFLPGQWPPKVHLGAALGDGVASTSDG